MCAGVCGVGGDATIFRVPPPPPSSSRCAHLFPDLMMRCGCGFLNFNSRASNCLYMSAPHIAHTLSTLRARLPHSPTDFHPGRHHRKRVTNTIRACRERSLSRRTPHRIAPVVHTMFALHTHAHTHTPILFVCICVHTCRATPQQQRTGRVRVRPDTTKRHGNTTQTHTYTQTTRHIRDTSHTQTAPHRTHTPIVHTKNTRLALILIYSTHGSVERAGGCALLRGAVSRVRRQRRDTHIIYRCSTRNAKPNRSGRNTHTHTHTQELERP